MLIVIITFYFFFFFFFAFIIFTLVSQSFEFFLVFQKTVINLLTKISNKLEDVTICGCSSLTQTQIPSNDETFKFCHINSMEELHKLYSNLNDDASFTSFVSNIDF